MPRQYHRRKLRARRQAAFHHQPLLFGLCRFAVGRYAGTCRRHLAAGKIPAGAGRQRRRSAVVHEGAMGTLSGDQYIVDDIFNCPQHNQQEAVAVYSAAVRRNGEINGEVLGVLGVFFAWQEQSRGHRAGRSPTSPKEQNGRVRARAAARRQITHHRFLRRRRSAVPILSSSTTRVKPRASYFDSARQYRRLSPRPSAIRNMTGTGLVER